MKKTRSDAKWNELSVEQQEQLESWLFEEHLSYDEALAKAKQELGFDGSRASVQRFYKVKVQERFLADLTDCGVEADEVEASAVDAGKLRRSGMKVMAQRFFQQVREEGIADVSVMAKLLLQSEANEIQWAKQEVQQKSMELRRQRLDFQREKWQYDTLGEVEKALTELNEIKAKADEENDPYAYNKKTNAMRIRLFGYPIPDLLPENAEQEAILKVEEDWDRQYNEAFGKLTYEEQRAVRAAERKNYEARLAKQIAAQGRAIEEMRAKKGKEAEQQSGATDAGSSGNIA